ncbi:hypothetical protein [Streptococcus halichoeri]|uniref:hypothetical protein n=1 Tax=Streptococcus halichoeri TaxID=254785 RepID=UPI00135B627C
MALVTYFFVANKGMESCLESLIKVGASLCYQVKEMAFSTASENHILSVFLNKSDYL